MLNQAPGNNLGQPAYPVPADQAMTTPQLRDLFLQSAIYKCQVLDAVTWSTGSTTNVRVVQTGVAEKITLEVNLVITIATATASAGPKAPYNLITQILYTDPSGNVRVNSPAWDLYLLQIAKKQWAFDPSTGLPQGAAWLSSAFVANSTWGVPVGTSTIPTPYAAGGMLVAANTVIFTVDIPLAMSRYDTRGSILLESATSQSFLSITMQGTLMATTVQVDTPFFSATGTVSSITGTITPTYYYWAPTWVDMGGQKVLPIPYEDLSIVHEVIAVRNSNIIGTSSDNRYTLPTGRSYYRLIAHYVNNNLLQPSAAFTGLTNLKFAYDGSTFTLNERLTPYFARQRRDYDRDWPLGMFLWDFVQRPWDSNHYGQLDAIYTTDATALTTPYFQVLRDCLYVAPVA